MTGFEEQHSRRIERNLKSPVNIGLIGLGNIGRVHYEALTQFPQTNFNVVAVSDTNLSDQAKGLIGSDVGIYTNYKELLDNPEVIAVSINTPPNTHFQLATDALNAGKHVLVEKPPALTEEECQRMIDLATKKDKVLFMAFHARYNAAVEAAKRELANKNVTGVDIKYAEYALNYHQPDGWIFNPDIAGGGVLMDSGINALSIITAVLPNIRFEPSSAHFEQSDDFKVETRAEIDLAFGKEGKGHMSMDWMHKGPEIRQVTFSTNAGDQYTVDIVNNHFIKNGDVVSGESNELQDFRLRG
ncbi:MAG: Gfo/Idh/MocA family protein [Candidatus Levyibacteriota bacterium]